MAQLHPGKYSHTSSLNPPLFLLQGGANLDTMLDYILFSLFGPTLLVFLLLPLLLYLAVFLLYILIASYRAYRGK